MHFLRDVTCVSPRPSCPHFHCVGHLPAPFSSAGRYKGRPVRQPRLSVQTSGSPFSATELHFMAFDITVNQLLKSPCPCIHTHVVTGERLNGTAWNFALENFTGICRLLFPKNIIWCIFRFAVSASFGNCLRRLLCIGAEAATMKFVTRSVMWSVQQQSVGSAELG